MTTDKDAATPLPPSGFTTDYTDPSSGAELVNAWIEVNKILYVPAQSCLVVFDVYKDEGCSANMTPVFSGQRVSCDYGDSDWTTYFDPSVMDQPNCDIQAQSLLYLQDYFVAKRTKPKPF